MYKESSVPAGKPTFETKSVRGSVMLRKCFRRPTNVSYTQSITTFHIHKQF